MRRLLLVLLLVFVLAPLGVLASKNDAPADIPHAYDANRDPTKDLETAIEEAHASDRNILLEVGGTWCKWCGYMDTFFNDHADLKELRDKNFVVMYVNMSEQNKNDKFLARFPEVKGCP